MKKFYTRAGRVNLIWEHRAEKELKLEGAQKNTKKKREHLYISKIPAFPGMFRQFQQNLYSFSTLPELKKSYHMVSDLSLASSRNPFASLEMSAWMNGFTTVPQYQ